MAVRTKSAVTRRKLVPRVKRRHEESHHYRHRGSVKRALPKTRRSGKIVLVALVFLVLIVVLMGLLGNTGHVATQKLEMQNAADSTAFSSTLWLARGMNTITANNHLVGEATALSVLHESLGGPELRLGLRKSTPESQGLDRVIRPLRISSPIGRIPSPYVPPFLTEMDRRLVNFVTQQTSPPGANEHSAFATLYDARITLKRDLAGWMTAKSIANLAFLIPPPFGYLPAIAAYATHIAGSVNIALVGKEWLMLRVLDVYAKAASPVQERVIDGQVIPTLCKFAGEVAGLESSIESSANPDDDQGFAAKQALEAVDMLSDSLRVTGSLFPAEELRLPVEFEPPPDGRGTTKGAEPQGWGDDNAVPLPDFGEARTDMESKLRRALRRMRRRVNDVASAESKVQQLRDAVSARASESEGELENEFDSELDALNALLSRLQSEREELESKTTEIESEQQTLEASLVGLAGGESENLSLDHVPLPMNAEQERWTQWVRATVPNLDRLRAPLLGLMKRHLKRSHAAEHFTKWTNRYALIAAWKFRSGQRLQKSGAASARWTKTNEPLGMLVLPGTFSQTLPQKGRESWTGRDAAARNEAEELFTVLSVAHREYEPLFSPQVFRTPQSSGITTVALGLLYNANRQSLTVSSSDSQPRVGWDTLNWDPAITSLPEWGSKATETSILWPWEIFDGANAEPLVKLNWQPKLMPVTESRLQQAVDEGDFEADAMAALELAIDYADLLTH